VANIIANIEETEQADAVFRELYQRFPQGRHAERAAWKAGWYSYKHGRYQEASALFEGAAANFPRSDYRPAYLYWSGRARQGAGDKTGGQTLLKLVAVDYLNSYYGRLAVKRLNALGVSTASLTRPPGKEAVSKAVAEVPEANGPAAGSAQWAVVRQLISLELYDAARDELLYAQRNGGDSPAVNATLAWIYNKVGDYRRGIIVMKRAYPAYMSVEAASLPSDLLKVIFPIDYWTLIKRYAPANNLDPYLVAALINQESSFAADARSSANAIGLMQLLPSTARRYARTLRIRRYSAGSLTRPEVNIQLGTAYFAELVRRLGGVHYALASYNAGEHRVAIWTSERPSAEREEFIDDIPFPETQGYVKKILGTAEDYRRLYGFDRVEGDDTARKSSVRPATKKASRPAAKPPSKKKPKPKTRRPGSKG
jgi:soluble lytic murein transglycosylase